MTVQTHKVTDRRSLHFNNIDEIAADVEVLAGGNVKALGNWSPGQILEHLAKTMDGSMDGMGFHFNWLFRFTATFLFKNRFLTKPMPPGWTLKGDQAKALQPSETSWEEGLHHFRQSIARLQKEERRVPHPVLGNLTRDEWNQLHCRHSELHLSFLKPAE
jgi:hypothetical protein